MPQDYLLKRAINEAGNDGLFFGNAWQFLVRLCGVGVSLGYAVVLTIILYLILDRWIGTRVEPEEEDLGLDLSQHRESAYGREVE